jgi:hypothetical protein
MPLSIEKLEQLLADKGLLIKRYFRLGRQCAFIEVIYVKTADTFMVSIPAKYKFVIDTNSNKQVYKLKPIELDKRDVNDYARSPDRIEIQQQYPGIDMPEEEELEIGDENVTDKLIDAYRRPITLRDLRIGDAIDLKDVFRQLARLKYCVQAIRYKLVIIYKSYLCVLGADDSIGCFYIRDFPKIDQRRLLIAADLELLYKKIETIFQDIRQVREGIYRVLNTNQNSHTRNLQKLLERRAEVALSSQKVHQKKETFKAYIQNFEKLLDSTLRSELATLEKLYNLEDGANEAGASMKGVFQDIDKSHQKKRIEDELNRVEKIKEEIVTNIMSLKDKNEHVALTVDKILFDNIVMLDNIYKNFELLSQLV